MNVLYVFHIQGPDGADLEGALIHAEGEKLGTWEGMTNRCGDFPAMLGPDTYHATISKPGFAPAKRDWVLEFPGPPIKVQLDRVAPGPTPPQPGNIRLWRGATCIPSFFDETVGPHRNLWTPAFLSKEYRNRWPEIVAKYKARGYDTLELIQAGMPYHNDFSEIFPDAGLLREGLSYLREAGLKTCVTLLDDRRGDDLSYAKPLAEACADLYDWVMPMYEMNAAMFHTYTVDKWDGTKWQGGLTDALINVKRMLDQYGSKALIGIHMTADHGGIGDPTNEWWRYASGSEMSGGGQSPVGRFADAVLFQCGLCDLNQPLAGQAVLQGQGLEEEAIRFTGQIPSWKGSSVDCNLFEVHTSYTYRNQMSEAQARDYVATMLKHAPTVSLSGYMDGGR